MAENILNIPSPKLYETEALYQEKLAAGEVDENDYSFVKETGVVYTKGGKFGGGGVEARLLQFDPDGSELTEEQRAYNVKIFNDLVAGNKIAVYVSPGPNIPLWPLLMEVFLYDAIIFYFQTFFSSNEIVLFAFTLKSDGSVLLQQESVPTGGSSGDSEAVRMLRANWLPQDMNNDFNNDFSI